MDLTPGRMLAHYRLDERLGAGAMGVVWLATDTVLEREVAIKLLPEAFANDRERLARFEREAKLLASLNHPNIAAVHGLHAADGVHFIVLELVRGETLTAAIAQGLPARRVLEIGEAIADALAAAHRKHVIHRDLKPDNIMIDADGRPKVLDFGLAKFADRGAPEAETLGGSALVTHDGTLLGTVAYMSPEQAMGKSADARSDVFSLGVILYEMASGKRPFTGDNVMSVLTCILRDTPPPLSEIRPDLPHPLGEIVARCLAKSPDDRYADAGELRDALRTLAAQLSSGSLPPLPGQRVHGRHLRTTALVALALLAVGFAGTWWWRRQARERWVRDEALPRLEKIVDRIQGLQEGRESWDAYVLAQEIAAVSPNEPLLARLQPSFARPITITSEPAGAEVLIRYYDDPNAPALVLGRTPLAQVEYPQGFTRIELRYPGRRTVQDVIWNFGLVGKSWSYRLFPSGQIPDDMEWIPGGSFPLYLPGLDHLKEERTAAFLMDRHEVNQREYKRFVDAGAYRRPELWKQPFVESGRPLSFPEAMARFVDRTGKPGPATWEVGTYPTGGDDLPVGGISWYEAAAYAAWAGKSLPTIYHWNRVAFTVGSSRIAPLANLAGNGPVPVGTTKSMNRYGVSDLAGNVREWVWNASTRNDQRFILGGGWNDPDYAFVDAFAQLAFDRSATNGVRCIRALEPEANAATLERTIAMPFRDFRAEQPVSDTVFADYLRQFTYDKLPLDAKIEEVKDTPDGVRQKISFSAAYGGERMLAYLFLPTNSKPPYQVAAVFPGSGSIEVRSSDNLALARVAFITKSGRAVLWPIYKGTYERGGDLRSDYPDETTLYKDYVIMWAKDLSRSIDYVESRPDLDAHRIAYYGLSWGAALGAILPAVETRIRANILYVAGLSFQRSLPEVDAINYIRHVRQPTLLLNGEFDFFFPVQTSQTPMFELLGTPADQKERHVYSGGHSVPRTEQIKESLRWLDRYLGPVATTGG